MVPRHMLARYTTTLSLVPAGTTDAESGQSALCAMFDGHTRLGSGTAARYGSPLLASASLVTVGADGEASAAVPLTKYLNPPRRRAPKLSPNSHKSVPS